MDRKKLILMLATAFLAAVLLSRRDQAPTHRGPDSFGSHPTAGTPDVRPASYRGVEAASWHVTEPDQMPDLEPATGGGPMATDPAESDIRREMRARIEKQFKGLDIAFPRQPGSGPGKVTE